MAIQKKSPALTKRTAALLAAGETEKVDFKKTLDGIHADDLVAFANTASGGEILAGVAEKTGTDGTQQGVIVGCDISDNAILQLLNRAMSCIPPISLKLTAENTADKPVLRVAIPASNARPHCTPKGVYCCRDGSRNRALHPGELLRIFLDQEAKTFASRFEESANLLTDELASLGSYLDESIRSMGDQLGWAEFKLGDTESTIDTILGYVKHLSGESSDTASRLRSLFRQDKRDDPVRAAARKQLLDEILEQFQGNPDLIKQIDGGAKLGVTAKGKAALELDKSDLQEIFDEALKAFREKAAPAADNETP